MKIDHQIIWRIFRNLVKCPSFFSSSCPICFHSITTTDSVESPRCHRSRCCQKDDDVLWQNGHVKADVACISYALVRPCFLWGNSRHKQMSENYHRISSFPNLTWALRRDQQIGRTYLGLSVAPRQQWRRRRPMFGGEEFRSISYKIVKFNYFSWQFASSLLVKILELYILKILYLKAFLLKNNIFSNFDCLFFCYFLFFICDF